MGERLLGRWLRQPLLDLAKIEARQDMVELLRNDAALRSGLQESALRGTPDLENLALRLQRKRAGVCACV
jgi:DNA mismatch repair protein MSH2